MSAHPAAAVARRLFAEPGLSLADSGYRWISVDVLEARDGSQIRFEKRHGRWIDLVRVGNAWLPNDDEG